jgi:hypothetical protein
MRTVAVALLVATAGCATGGAAWSPHVTPIYQYRGYGEYLPERSS